MKYHLKYTSAEKKEVEKILQDIASAGNLIKKRKERLREIGNQARGRMTPTELKEVRAQAAKKGAATRKRNQAKKARK